MNEPNFFCVWVLEWKNERKESYKTHQSLKVRRKQTKNTNQLWIQTQRQRCRRLTIASHLWPAMISASLTEICIDLWWASFSSEPLSWDGRKEAQRVLVFNMSSEEELEESADNKTKVNVSTVNWKNERVNSRKTLSVLGRGAHISSDVPVILFNWFPAASSESSTLDAGSETLGTSIWLSSREGVPCGFSFRMHRIQQSHCSIKAGQYWTWNTPILMLTDALHWFCPWDIPASVVFCHQVICNAPWLWRGQ